MFSSQYLIFSSLTVNTLASYYALDLEKQSSNSCAAHTSVWLGWPRNGWVHCVFLSFNQP